MGANRQGYPSPVVDELIDRYAITLRQEERWRIEREVIRHVLGDAAIGPLFFIQGNIAVAAGVTGGAPSARRGRTLYGELERPRLGPELAAREQGGVAAER